MVEVVHSGAVPGTVTVTQSRTSWGLELGRHRVRVTRTREARTIGAPGGAPAGRARPRDVVRPAWPLAIGVFASVSAFGLFVVGAIASEPSLPRQQARYSLSLPVPARVVKVSRASTRRGADKARARPAQGDAPAWLASLSGPRFDAADEPYVVRAMRAGAFQEWIGADGQRRFLNAGPEQAEGDRHCRDLALLIRDPDGSSRTRTARRCVARPPGQAVAVVTQVVPPSHAPAAPDVIAPLPPHGNDAPASAGAEAAGGQAGR